MAGGNFFNRQFDYEEDEYDLLNKMNKKKSKYDCFTNKSTRKKPEYDYEEDPYEP
ncbi:hypothetical protein [Alkalibacter saccharofermentans]|uniref:Uncharacterized protein n=1 Tax=Alkalibacter saccharofermentans DSM 14828 TaxID=1120975 RepID=A0A1M4WXI2_9FIRM|nr:hypothetical protein [Alkalibacter saccharofermentans]SHE85900.1 hypothetical protein SAMN02746064_01346 [Alkalibacter saccharofermentans DSM 14828]